MEKNPFSNFKKQKKSRLFICFTLLTVPLLSSLFIINPFKNVESYETRKCEAVNGICSNEYILFTTSRCQNYKDVGDDAMFMLNGGSVCDPGDSNDIDNVHIKFINGSSTTNIKNCFFKVKNMDYPNQYVYGLRTPNYGSATYTRLTFHLWTGNNRKRRTEYYPITFNVTIDLDSSFSSNLFHIDCNSKTITSHENISSESIYNSFGRYFLSMCPCSGRGDETDRENISSSWTRIQNEKIFTDNKIPAELKSYFASYDSFDGSDFALAIERYDYILFYKKYELDDFLNRSNLVGERYKSHNVAQFIYQKEDTQTLIIIIASSISLISITTLIVVMIKKHHLKE